MRGSDHELIRVLRNLLVNAIRHTPSDQTIEVVAGQTADYAWLAVQDGCGGIDPDDLPRVFDVAFRGAAARSPQAGCRGGRRPAPGWGWPSPAGSCRRTAARSASATTVTAAGSRCGCRSRCSGRRLRSFGRVAPGRSLATQLATAARSAAERIARVIAVLVRLDVVQEVLVDDGPVERRRPGGAAGRAIGVAPGTTRCHSRAQTARPPPGRRLSSRCPNAS